MQLNSITTNNFCNSKAQNTVFKGNEYTLAKSASGTDFAKKALNEIEHLHSNINMITFSNAIDTRMNIRQEMIKQVAVLKEYFVKMSVRSIKK